MLGAVSAGAVSYSVFFKPGFCPRLFLNYCTRRGMRGGCGRADIGQVAVAAVAVAGWL